MQIEPMSECYCYNMKKSAAGITEFYDQAVCESGLSMSQYFLLRRLFRLESANISQWAKEVQLERTTMVRNVKVLEKYNLIQPAQGNGKTYELSVQGKRALEKAVPIWEERQRYIEHYLGKEDAAALLRIAGKLQNLSEKETAENEANI